MILIISSQSDFHSHAISKGLEELGQHYQQWNLDGSPFDHEISLGLQEGEYPRIRNRRLGTTLDTGGIRTIWYRRNGRVTPPPALPAGNHDTFSLEWQDAGRGLLHLLDLGTSFWANHWIEAWRAENKVLQLATARAMGFRIPRTLISNSAGDVRAFHEQQGGNIVHKMFNPAVFGSGIACTAKLAPELLNQTSSLELCPGIFQELLDIAFEARVLVAGQDILAARLVNSGKKGIDIRLDQLQGLQIAPMELPAEIHDACIRLTQRLGLCTCSIDLACTRSGQWFFLEANQAGQFLWMELHEPELRTLDLMCRFLASGSADFKRKGKPVLRLADHLPKEFLSRQRQELQYAHQR